MQPRFHQALLGAHQGDVQPHQRDAIYPVEKIKSTGNRKEAQEPTHLREVFANKASNIINLNYQNIINILYTVTETIQAYI